MFPIRDHNPSERTPFVTYALIAMNIVIFLTYYPFIGNDPHLLMEFYADWGLTPANLYKGNDPHTLLSYIFLHGGWMHLVGNMLFLWIFGDNLEDLLGHFGFLLFYLASGAAAGLGHMLSDPVYPVPMVGASGAIAGVMGGYLLMFPRARIDMLVILVVIFKVFTIPAWLMLGLWFTLQLFNGVAVGAENSGIAYWAHAGGFIAGIIIMLPVWLRRGGPGYWATTHGKPPHEDVEYRVTRRRSGIPRIHRHSAPRGADDRPISDLSRIPPAGNKRDPSSPWSGGRR
ncbi:rhomboid family intramembrane serine protease [Rhodophyticola sp. CCM32]|uniref:rhomboid family intramembrane serine protease n=1 Tax=Rhodophyticola sp. CCM32 TaxID=2916397 RepID=UPI00107F9DC8|nr:rhomboid family intramembrane serine protease [Rhodophyticola sp. CCM32]QBX99389.1 rhomboid family intramembrane serine protease [Rhodophyticola sp. CCM32]